VPRLVRSRCELEMSLPPRAMPCMLSSMCDGLGAADADPLWRLRHFPPAVTGSCGLMLLVDVVAPNVLLRTPRLH
jgi:hypothetical protein